MQLCRLHRLRRPTCYQVKGQRLLFNALEIYDVVTKMRLYPADFSHVRRSKERRGSCSSKKSRRSGLLDLEPRVKKWDWSPWLWRSKHGLQSCFRHSKQEIVGLVFPQCWHFEAHFVIACAMPNYSLNRSRSGIPLQPCLRKHAHMITKTQPSYQRGFWKRRGCSSKEKHEIEKVESSKGIDLECWILDYIPLDSVFFDDFAFDVDVALDM